MAIDDADRADAETRSGESGEAAAVSVGAYTWADFLREFGTEADVESLSEFEGDVEWKNASVDPETYLGFAPDETAETVGTAAADARRLAASLEGFEPDDAAAAEPARVSAGRYTWDDYRTDLGGEAQPPAEALGFPPEHIENALARGGKRAGELDDVVDRRTVDVAEELDEDAFFRTDEGLSTIVSRYDLERAVPMEKKTHFQEVERYWVNKPHAFVIIFHSVKENEKKYYVVEPHQNRIEKELREFLSNKLRTAIKYSEEGIVGESEENRRQVIQQQALELLERYDLFRAPESGRVGTFVVHPEALDAEPEPVGGGLLSSLTARFGFGGDGSDEGGDTAATNASTTDDGRPRTQPSGGLRARLSGLFGGGEREATTTIEGYRVRPEPAVLAEDTEALTEYEVDKLLYYLTRNFIGYERIDGIKHDINVEDISCDGYNSPVFVYHSDYEQIISNVYHGEEELDDFVVKLAQRSGKGISKRRPQVDATLPDGSRAQLTLGTEVSDHGTNYTIRQFKDVPFTPVDLINWKTFSLDEMAFLWLAIENNKSLLFAGGTASGKTTSLNAVSLFIPSNAKIVSIEDTREVELPQRNWVASVTRPSFADNDQGDIDEFDLLEAALRQRPDYIVMGEVRGEEGRTLFQVMSTGHTTYTTFHADSVGEVLKRFTTEPINVSKTMFTALDLVSIQSSTRVGGKKVRRSKSITEINHYDAENDEINVQDIFQWQAETDEFLKLGSSNKLEEIRFDRGWSHAQLDEEMFKRRVVLAYLIDRGLNTYTEVAATLQAFINDQDTILTLMANDRLEASLQDLREMESVLIDIEPEKEEMVPRPDPGERTAELAVEILERAEEELFPDYRDLTDESVESALRHIEASADVTATGSDTATLDQLADDAERVAEADADVDAEADADVDAETEPEEVARPDETAHTEEANADEVASATQRTDADDGDPDTETPTDADDGDSDTEPPSDDVVQDPAEPDDFWTAIDDAMVDTGADDDGEGAERDGSVGTTDGDGGETPSQDGTRRDAPDEDGESE